MEAKYYIAINGKPKGPFSIEELKKLTITAETVVWKDGLPNWVKATEIEEVNNLIKIPVKPDKITPPPLSAQPFDIQQTSHINRIEIIKSILRLDRKWVFGIILLTVVSYALIAYLEGGFQAMKLYNKYTELIKTPQEQARIYSLAEDKQFAKELAERQNHPIDSTRKSPLSEFIKKINKGHQHSPNVSDDFVRSEQTPVLTTVISRDLSEYRLYLDNPDPTDPNLDNKMIDALSDKINNSYGLPTILEALGIFVLSNLILIANSRLWKS